MVVHFAHFKFRPGKGVILNVVGVVLCKDISSKGFFIRTGVGCGTLGKVRPNLGNKVRKHALELHKSKEKCSRIGKKV